MALKLLVLLLQLAGLLLQGRDLVLLLSQSLMELLLLPHQFPRAGVQLPSLPERQEALVSAARVCDHAALPPYLVLSLLQLPLQLRNFLRAAELLLAGGVELRAKELRVSLQREQRLVQLDHLTETKVT